MRSQAVITLLLFIVIFFVGSIVSGVLEFVDIRIEAVPVYLPLPTITSAVSSNIGVWLANAAVAATIAGFLGSYLGKRVLVFYRYVEYPSDHLKVLKLIRIKPRTMDELVKEMDAPPSVIQRVLEDLMKDGLVLQFSKDDKAIYFFPMQRIKK
ncbi:MAG: hypothetical protein OH344_02495 [Candidatus Parvarchaeota archaeon]|nr:hypothetical protein [Candidatus Jingweiarchaeum tengchongense]